MSSKPSKFKINLQQGTIEIEGDEEFVKTLTAEYKPFIMSLGEKTALPQTPPEAEKGAGRKRAVKNTSFTPIPLDLKADDDHPSLRDFYTEKKPTKNNMEKTLLFVYYLTKYKGIKDVLPGHLISCYDEVGARKPKRPDQSIRDTTHLKGWLRPGSTSGSANITIAGENYIEHDLPRKK